jgi:enoyl-CoA hydratase/carnithine racemase
MAAVPKDDQAYVLREDREGIATLTLNRPAQMNLLTAGMLAALQDALDSIARDASIRVVVLAAAGKGFCAGHDLKEIRALGEQPKIAALFAQCSRMMLSIPKLPQPVIAKVQGAAAAAGAQLVAQCDLAVAADTAKFVTSGVSWGFFCSTPGRGHRPQPADQARDGNAAHRGANNGGTRNGVGTGEPRGSC